MKRFKSMVAGLVSAVMATSMMPCMMVMADGISIEDCFPDEGFRTYVSEHFDTDGNRYLSNSEIQNATEINFAWRDVYSLEGIGNLTELKSITITACRIPTIDLSGNLKLEELTIRASWLKNINISNCSELTYLDLSVNDIDSIDLSGNRNLTFIGLSYNNITSLNISGYTDLNTLYCDHNLLTTLNLSENPNLQYIQCNKNNLSTIDVSLLSNLGGLNCSDNELTHIDITNNTNLTNLVCSNNAISELDITNNVNLMGLECGGNPIDSLNLSKNTQITTLDISGLPLGDVDFSIYPNLIRLNCSGCNINNIDLSNNTLLEQLNCSNNNIQTLNISNNKNLIILDCSNNKISSLDFSECTTSNYFSLFCNNNELTSIEGLNAISLQYFIAHENHLQTLDIIGSVIMIAMYNSPDNNDSFIVDGQTVITHGHYTEPHALSNARFSYDEGVTIITTPTPSVTPTVQPTTRPTTPPTVNPTVAPTSNPTVAPTATPETGVGGFVERLYTIALDRPSDSAGKADWVNRVYTQGATGADVASGFLFSPEFLGKDMSTQDFLAVLYRVFFDRAGDQGGIDYWTNNMNNGMDKQTVIWGFINSTEWANVCLRFGIASGGNGIPNITIEPAPEIIAFATRLYTTCLGRPADQGGLNDWSHRLANRQISGSEAAYGFFFSSEFVNDSSIDNAEYINRLYQTFMNRPADTAGFNDWMNRMNNGASREDVFNGFAGSQEWANICSSYGILK